ncbi:TetR/AcrR family transcriptional regulator [Tuberibacillus sp. Marseille-P3662]|uniref:TetR/AcrR family transcriptional regulator n=1 Tax=Tuberibacillus sp. Marseille-P3662 TaxID=1965358 RepID=UPI000A1CADF7|nr:TetR/AcrR family transcriptional regulator [Tuberibacillus sp. Marseille-P3662]
MGAENIMVIALKHFAQNGYDGTSLSAIAADVGIKKPSIYAHFKSKEALFLSILNKTADREYQWMSHYLSKEPYMNFRDRLYQLLQDLMDRYKHDDHLQFWLRVVFFPPAALYEQVMQRLYNYLDQCEQLITKIFEREGLINVAPGEASIAFMGILDSLFVELLYGGPDRAERRVQASWKIFWRGIKGGDGS